MALARFFAFGEMLRNFAAMSRPASALVTVGWFAMSSQ
jgi:hypothetical protein